MKLAVLDAKTFGADLDLDVLCAGFQASVHAGTAPAELAARLAEAEVAVTNKVPLRAADLAAAPRLRLIAVAATGYDQVDLAAAAARGIAVANVPGYATASAAAHSFALYFGLAHQLAYHHRYCATGAWSASDCFTHLARPWPEPDGQVWGIVGLGAIGRAVAERAEAFGFEVVYHSTSGRNPETRWPRLALAELLTRADVVSLHAPLNPQTLRLIDAPRLALMKPTALLINTGRGALIDEAALADALSAGALAGAGLDVLSQEPPPPDHPLLTRDFGDRLLLSPHIGGLSTQSRRRLVAEVRANIDAFLAGHKRNLVSGTLSHAKPRRREEREQA